jgi:hypothetical protein
VFLFFFLLGYPAPAVAADSDASFNLGVTLTSLFKEFISPVDGDRCPSEPTCSSYSIKAFEKHGFFVGWLMTVDRLLHEGGDEKMVSPVWLDRGRQRILDPVENNDFWWYGTSENAPQGR